MIARRSIGKLVLVVEDDSETREVMAIILRQDGYTVLAVEDGRRALDYLQTEVRPAAIVLDMLLPVLDGWRLLQELQRLPELAALPIVIATATVLSRE
jgi:CheY-like chemotaxis protein